MMHLRVWGVRGLSRIGESCLCYDLILDRVNALLKLQSVSLTSVCVMVGHARKEVEE